MARRRKAEKRTLVPDPKFNSELVARVINYIMQDGKKTTAERIVYSSTRRGVSMQQAVAMELMDAYNGQGNVMKKRDDTHRMAQANKAFAHYAW